MDDRAISPSTIIVLADDIHIYAWSGAGDCLGHSGLKMIAGCFPDHPALSELVDLEYEFWDWAATWPTERYVSSGRWQQFHHQGLRLARRLGVLMRGLKVQVFYRSAHSAFMHQQLDIGPL